MSKYKFVTNFENSEEEQNNNILFFYQICTFPDPVKKTYPLRQFTINNKNEFINIKKYNLKESQLKKFLGKKKSNEYSLFSTYDLETINYPSLSDILILKSDNLSNKYNYYGAAPF